MVGIMGGGGTSVWEPISLLVGLINLLSAIFFFLYKFEILQLGVIITDDFFLLYFPTLIIISGIMHLLSTIGVFGMK